jgi:hypothetical protein
MLSMIFTSRFSSLAVAGRLQAEDRKITADKPYPNHLNTFEDPAGQIVFGKKSFPFRWALYTGHPAQGADQVTARGGHRIVFEQEPAGYKRPRLFLRQTESGKMIASK